MQGLNENDAVITDNIEKHDAGSEAENYREPESDQESVSEMEKKDSIYVETPLGKLEKKAITSIAILAGAALILGIIIGRFSQPKGKLDAVVVTESASAADSGKEYTQIVSIMDNAKHVVEERY